MSDEGEGPLADRADAAGQSDRSDDAAAGSGDDATAGSDDAVDQWVEDVATEAEREQGDEDPFERIGEGTGPRHGDPFDAFETEEEAAESKAADATEQPGLPSGNDTDADPFTEFDEPTTDPFGEGETVFAGADVDETSDDGVWERMESTDSEAEAVPGKRYVDVNKHSYCETCEYFSEPPDVGCSHEGTEILEFVDMDTVRVADCPIVAERKALEDID